MQQSIKDHTGKVYKRYPAGPMGEYCKYTAGSNRHKPYQRKDIIKRAVRTRDQISNRLD